MTEPRLGVRVRVFPDPESLAVEGARTVLTAARAALAARGVFRVALAGGSTPLRTYAEMVRRIPEVPGGAARWDVWFGDERCVPLASVDSNAGRVEETLLRHLHPRPTVHRVPTTDGDAARAAAGYARELEIAFGIPPGSPPVFDLVLLGLGADGHTASLFPGDAALEERERWVAPARAPKPPVERVTLTFPVIDAARAVLFLVTGADKRRALATVLDGVGEPVPASRVRPVLGTLAFFADRAARPTGSRP